MGKFGGEDGSDSHVPGLNGEPTTSSSSSGFLCQRFCLIGSGGVSGCFSFKCLVVSIVSLCVFLPAFFLLIPPRSLDSGFEASEAIKTSAPAQAYFRLRNPVSQLVPHIQQLEQEIYNEIGVPDARVAITSMHKSGASDSNSTYVVFGIVPHKKGGPINPVSLSVLKSSLIELFLMEANLTLTNSRFGVPSSFEILKFRGGITVIPRQPVPLSQIIRTLFNFTINNSVHGVTQNLDLLTKQLKMGLHLRVDENVYVQVTNKDGSTVKQPVVIQAAVLSNAGGLRQQRLMQLAQTINSSSPSKNLGLNNTMFGRVKSVRLSSYLQHTIEAIPPSSSPASPPNPSIGVPSPSPGGNVHHIPASSPSPQFSIHPSGSCDELSPDFQPFTSLQNVNTGSQEKSSNDILIHDIMSYSNAATQLWADELAAEEWLLGYVSSVVTAVIWVPWCRLHNISDGAGIHGGIHLLVWVAVAFGLL